jgi:uncharacterized protein YxeA
LKKAGITVIVLILVILGGWLILRPRQTATTKPVTATSTKVKKSSSSTVSSSSSVSSKATKSSSSSHSESVDKSNVRTTKDKPATATTTQQSGVDTKNLTTEQVNEWVWSDLQADYSGQGMNIQDFLFETDMRNDGLVYIDVRENHDTEDMKAQGLDPKVNPMIAFYRISDQGYLERSNDAGDHWDVVSRDYQN